MSVIPDEDDMTAANDLAASDKNDQADLTRLSAIVDAGSWKLGAWTSSCA